MSNFAKKFAPYASVIVNGIYWSPETPRLLTIPDAKALLTPGSMNPFHPTSRGGLISNVKKPSKLRFMSRRPRPAPPPPGHLRHQRRPSK